MNALLVAILPFLFADLLATIRHGPKRPAYTVRQTFKEAICLASFPLVYFFGFLYYTDVASLTMVLLCYRQALLKRYSSSASVRLNYMLNSFEALMDVSARPAVPHLSPDEHTVDWLHSIYSN